MRALAVSALLGLTASACGGDATGPSGPGTGSVSATGAVSTSGSGVAMFQSITSGATSLFQLMVMPSQSNPVWTVQIANYSGRLAAGTYALSPLSATSTNPTANFYYTSAGSMRMFNATSGQLVITSSTSSGVRGTYTFTGLQVDGTATVTAQGSFDAICAPGTACQ